MNDKPMSHNYDHFFLRQQEDMAEGVKWHDKSPQYWCYKTLTDCLAEEAEMTA